MTNTPNNFGQNVRKGFKIIDDIGVEIIAMHYGIVWGKRQRALR